MNGPMWEAIANACQLFLGVVLLVAVLKLCNTLYDIDLLYRSMQSDINRLRAPRVHIDFEIFVSTIEEAYSNED